MKNTYELYFIVKSHLDKAVYQDIEKSILHKKWEKQYKTRLKVSSKKHRK